MTVSERPVSLTFRQAAWRVFDVSIGEMLWSRRTIFMMLIVGAPVAIAVVLRGLELAGVPPLRVNGIRVEGATIFGILMWILYLRFIVPVLGAFYGTSLIADEVDDKTITYLFTRPVPRGAVAVGKYLSYLACTLLVVLPSVILVYFLVLPIAGGSIAATFPSLLRYLAVLSLGLIAYGAFFAFIGARLKRPLLFGLAFAFGWESAVQVLPGYFKRFTIGYYLGALMPREAPQEGLAGLLRSFFGDQPDAWIAVAALLLITVVFLAWTARTVARREYVLEQ
jgi:ABC-type transport system involved in multi-copper enzyme maturation permease subunit